MSSRKSLPLNPAVHHPRELSRHATGRSAVKPAAAYRQRHANSRPGTLFNAPEVWHEPTGRLTVKVQVQQAGEGYLHPASPAEIRARIAELPAHLIRNLEVVQLSRMTRKRQTFPCYGMQWGPAVYLYPIEESLVETYYRPPKPAQQVEARMFGAVWSAENGLWKLTWTRQGIKDFYLNNVLIHEIGHLNDPRNTGYRARETYANWFAIEYGYRASRGR